MLLFLQNLGLGFLDILFLLLFLRLPVFEEDFLLVNFISIWFSLSFEIINFFF